MEEDNKLVEERREKLKALRAKGNAYPNDFRRKDFSRDLISRFGSRSKEELEKEKPPAVVAGRMMLKRVMGKASFATLQDGSGQMQAYVTQDVPGYEEFKHWDLGDEGPPARESAAAAAREVPRPDRSGGALPPALR